MSDLPPPNPYLACNWECPECGVHGEGVPETEIARVLGVNRMTVRRWLGKQ